jgi:UDP-2,4-diacetamido-2,4,6-trideoxy-beta-L-altropyranose hydrolase
MAEPQVLFRVDATSAMGMGHLMRCRAIAEALADLGAHCVFGMVEPLPAVVSMMNNMNATLMTLPGPPGSHTDLEAVLQWIRLHQPYITLVDGYHLSDDYQRAVSQVSLLAALWDAADHTNIEPDVIIDASANAPVQDYARLAPRAKLLLGPKHALIRREIRKTSVQNSTPIAQRQQLVVTFGGSDPLNLSMALLPELARRLPAEAQMNFVVGAAYPKCTALIELAHTIDPTNARIQIHQNPASLAQLFCSAGLAISAAGGTIGELVALGVPTLSVIVADNQVMATAGGPYPCVDGRLPNAAITIAEKAAHLWLRPSEREQLSQRVQGIVDGHGAKRVANVLLSTELKKRLLS